ncbi:T6SS phospholipase effector Tle1-like catalytic domain-containing protein [Bradyrhizobium sp. USDA 10063]
MGTQRGEAARGGVTGWGIDDEIIEAYTWLVQNFDDGDEIFIFGFSRGAYTARSLSGLSCKCGVLKLGAPLSIEQLYARYCISTMSSVKNRAQAMV